MDNRQLDPATSLLLIGLMCLSAFALVAGVVAAAIDISKRIGWL